MKEQVIIDIAPDGDVKISVEGAEGGNCVKLTKAFEKALGTVKERKYKDEYFRKSEKPKLHREA